MSANRFVLTSIQQFGEGGAVNGAQVAPTRFVYRAPKAGWHQRSHELPIGVPAVAGGLKFGRAYRIGDFTGSGIRSMWVQVKVIF